MRQIVELYYRELEPWRSTTHRRSVPAPCGPRSTCWSTCSQGAEAELQHGLGSSISESCGLCCLGDGLRRYLSRGFSRGETTWQLGQRLLCFPVLLSSLPFLIACSRQNKPSTHRGKGSEPRGFSTATESNNKQNAQRGNSFGIKLLEEIFDLT